MNIIEKLNKIFQTVFDDNEISIRPEMTADDIDGWDSLSHVNLIVAVENLFHIKFTQRELLVFRNIGDLLKGIEAKVVAQ